jgi:hypothetical protein
MAPGHAGGLRQLAFRSGRLAADEGVAPLDGGEALALPEVRDAWAAFRLVHEGEWRGFADRRTGRLAYAEGEGIPWIPGRGNRLTLADLAPVLGGRGAVDLTALETIARGFLAQSAKLLGVDPAVLALDRGRSGQAADYLWLVDFQVLRGGRVVEGARVTLTINHGNLIQLGTVKLPAADAAVPAIAVTREQALATLAAYAGGGRGLGPGDRFVDPGSLHLLPVDTGAGGGRGLVAVWDLAFRRDGVVGTWRGRIDATTGELLAFGDVNDYAQVTGGVYPRSYATDAEVARPMPFAALSSGGATDSAGHYDFPGGVVSADLTGPYVSIADVCGPVAESGSASGRIAFGLSAGTDCATPGVGGPGNTHAARMQFYQINRIKETGRGWLPANAWLSGALPVNVNLNATCNAYWNGSSLNFFQSGNGCGNTGEIAGVSLHEYGHGLDQNDGGGESPDGGTRESYADVTSTLVTHDSCDGPGFLAFACDGYGDACTACTGVRDIDWAHHASAAPHTVANFTQAFCPPGFGDDGPCGAEAHCESYVPSEAIWDLAARDLPGAGGAAAWATVERLWYRSRAAAGSAFTCNTAAATWTSSGCAAGSLWRVLRAADDDDGNLANGTPHSCALYAALNRHGLACPGDPGAATCFAACTPPAAPALTLTPGVGQMQLNWTGAGAGTVFDVYRNELGCNAGFARVASGLAAGTYLDTAVASGLTYSYQVIAHPNGSEACSAAPSACQSASPVPPACSLAVPAALTATPASARQVTLAWSAVAGITDYNVYRATAAGGPYTLVRSVTGATSWTDSGLAGGSTYFYVVRAVGDCESASSPEASATTFTCAGSTIYSNDFESGSGLGDWTTGTVGSSPTSDWRGIQTCAAHGGQHVFRFGGAGCGDPYDINHVDWAQIGGAAGIAVPAGVADVRLDFWHRWDFEYGYDFGSVQVSLDGASFVTLPGSAYLAGRPNLGAGFTGQEDAFVHSVADLDAGCNLAGAGGAGCAGRTVYVRFFAESDVSIVGQGWSLDDVAITGCFPHGCTGAPAAGAATAPGASEIQVSWGNGSPAAASFNVYRAVGTCAAPGPFAPVASRVAGSPFLDAPVSGSVPYAYRVTGLEATGLCESDPSACVEATTTGPCTAPPTFAGLSTAATPLCGGPAAYDVYRSTVPGFTPDPRNRIATGVAGTSFADPGSLVDGVTYYYLVRAVDLGNGAADGNLVRRAAAPSGVTTIGTFSETFEGTASGGGFDHPGWSHVDFFGPFDWTWSTREARSPSHSWFSASSDTPGDRALISPPFGALAGTTLSFWHSFEFDACYDGGTLDISTDGGLDWTGVPAAAFTAGGYVGTIYGGPSPIYGRAAWCGGALGAPLQVTADLSAYAGSQVRLAWHAGDSGSFAHGTGWFVDSVTLSPIATTATCTPAPAPAADFYTLAPCRLVDTRSPAGALGGPALAPHGQRTFVFLGVCGVPATARALALNVTVVQTPAAGDLRLFPSDQPAPPASVINFRPGRTRANEAIVALSADTGAVTVKNDSAGSTILVIDVDGYFQ